MKYLVKCLIEYEGYLIEEFTNWESAVQFYRDLEEEGLEPKIYEAKEKSLEE